MLTKAEKAADVDAEYDATTRLRELRGRTAPEVLKMPRPLNTRTWFLCENDEPAKCAGSQNGATPFAGNVGRVEKHREVSSGHAPRRGALAKRIRLDLAKAQHPYEVNRITMPSFREGPIDPSMMPLMARSRVSGADEIGNWGSLGGVDPAALSSAERARRVGLHYYANAQVTGVADFPDAAAVRGAGRGYDPSGESGGDEGSSSQLATNYGAGRKIAKMHQDTVSAIEGGLSKIQARRRANQAALQAELAKTNALARQLRAAGLLR